MPYAKYLAAGAVVGEFKPTQLFAGEAPIITDSAPLDPSETDGVNIYDVLALTNDGTVRRLIAADVPASDPQDPPTATADSPFRLVVAAQGGQAGDNIPYYEAGTFNHEALNWPEELDTYQKRKLFCQGTAIRPRHLI